MALILVIFLTGCQKEAPDTGSGTENEVVFTIYDGRGTLKSGSNCAFDVDYAMVIISHIVKNKRVYENFFTGTYLENAVLYTFPMTLPILPKNQYYRVEECLLYADEDKIHTNPTGDRLVSAAPHEGSNFGSRIPDPLNLEFEIDAFNKTDVGLSVFCFNGSDPADYGFVWFQPTVVVVKQKWFYGSFFPDNYLDYTGSSYDLAGELAVDMPAIYKVQVFRDKNLDNIFSGSELVIEYGNEKDYLTGKIQPLSVQYADGPDGNGHFELRFLAYLRVGGSFIYKEVGSVYFEGDNAFIYRTPVLVRKPDFDPGIDPGDDNIFEFAISNSNTQNSDFRFGT